MRKNILILNLKGGASKSTNSSIAASYLKNSTLIEIDKINKSDQGIKQKEYDSKQIDFNNEQSEEFLAFENLLLENGTKIIDVGAVKLETFYKAMSVAALWDVIDLLVVPAMDGRDDFIVAMKMLENISEAINPEKIIFSFNRYNPEQYPVFEEQFDSFYKNAETIKKKYKIDILADENFFLLNDNRAVKMSRAMGVSMKSLIDQSIDKLTTEQRAEKDNAKRLEMTRHRSLVLNAHIFYNECVIPMISKIQKKLG